MELKNKETGKTEFAPDDVARGFVEAGTHAYVNRDENGEVRKERAKPKTASEKA